VLFVAGSNQLMQVIHSARKRNAASLINYALPVILTGVCWYWGNGLSGEYWYLVWLAPIPTLASSFYYPTRLSFRLALVACLLGRLSWFTYLYTVMPLWLAVLLTAALAYAYARIAVHAGRQMVALYSGYSLFIYPVLMTALEFVVQIVSPDGTASSLAYTQADVLPIIQIASLTGSLGITFLVSLFPSLCAYGWLAYHRRKKRIAYAIAAAVSLYGLTLFYGYYRLANPLVGSPIKAGLVALNEPVHYVTQQRNEQPIHAGLAEYMRVIASLADAGADVVLLPETAFRLTSENKPLVMATLQHIATENGIQLIAGLADYSQSSNRNAAVVIDPNGNIKADYTKNHLVRGFERQFTPGHQIGLFLLDTVPAGVAICKDLDFPEHIRAYGLKQAAIMFVPANDFVVDDWLHARMAILRGVENGCSVVRAAWQGRLTISDPFGRILAEANSSTGRKTALLGTVPAIHQATLYTRIGNAFGLLMLLVASYFFWLFRANRITEQVGQTL
jgi:apolipoprotein N-acyltransferase